jgi:hypothetical protein
MSISSLSQIAVTLLGPPIEHRDSLISMLDGRVGRVCWVPDSATFRKGKRVGLRRRFNRFTDQVRGTSDPEYLNHIRNSLDESRSRLVIAYWSTIPLPDLAAIKSARPDIKLVLMTLCYPMALNGIGIRRQNFFMRRAAGFLDGILYPSQAMERYFRQRVFHRRAPSSAVIPPCWPASFQSGQDLPSIQPTPNLIYVGRTDLASRTIHAADDIRPLMRGILDAGIDLHHVHSAETDDGHPHRKSFAPLTITGLVAKMAHFDASLIAYNTAACGRDDRFALTVPDRLISSVAAGVPVAIPRRGYAGAKQYLKDYPAVIEFDSPEELAATLADRGYVAHLRNAAWNARQKYSATPHGDDLQKFLEQLLGLQRSANVPLAA